VVEVWSEPLRSSGSVGGVVSTFIMVQASAVVHTGTSSRTDESKTFSIATLNIKIFNIMVDAIVREWQSLWERRNQGCQSTKLCPAYSLLYSMLMTDTLPQQTMDVLIALFERGGLGTNENKTKAETH
jgi:hypothetical protein